MIDATAVAIFVKTPGVSPVKTRLAQTIGPERALEFYRLSVRAIEETVLKVQEASDGKIVGVWAVAEEGAMGSPVWGSLPRTSQGEGSLGERLDHVYRTLLGRYRSVMLIGADSPQLQAKELLQAGKMLRASEEFILGKAWDGGFYLWGGSQEIPTEVWKSVPYSVPETSQRLLEAIRGLRGVSFLPEMLDVDTEKEMWALRDQLSAMEELTPSQERLWRWLTSTEKRECR